VEHADFNSQLIINQQNYRKQSCTTNASYSTSNQHHGHGHRPCADSTSDNEKYEGQLQSVMTAINIRQGGKNWQKHSRREKVRCTYVTDVEDVSLVMNSEGTRNIVAFEVQDGGTRTEIKGSMAHFE
jgi:hypothetical protein